MNQEFTFADCLRGHQNRARLIGAELAEELEVSHQTIKNWLLGNSLPRYRDQIIKLKGILRLSPDELNMLLKLANHPTINFRSPTQATKNRRPLQVPTRFDNFVNRENEIIQIADALKPGNFITICGLTGMGKSALATEIIWRLLNDSVEAHDYFPNGIISHDFHDENRVDVVFEKVLREMGHAPNSTSFRNAAKRVLENKNILLLLDGGEEADHLEELVSIRGISTILLTTRNRHDAGNIRIDLMPLNKFHSFELLKLWCKNENIEQITFDEFYERVGGHPLAVYLTGRILSAESISLEELLEYINQDDGTQSGIGLHGRYYQLAFLLQKTFESLDEKSAAFLSTLSFLALSPIDLEFVSDVMGIPKTVAGLVAGVLVNIGVLKRDKNYVEISHTIVLQYVKQNLCPSQSAIRNLAKIFSIRIRNYFDSDGGNFLEIDKIVPHLLVFLRNLASRNQHSTIRSLVRTTDQYLGLRSLSTEREEILKIGIRSAEILNDQTEKAYLGNALGLAYLSIGKSDLASEIIAESLTISQTIQHEDLTVLSLTNLGYVHYTIGKDYTKALNMAEQAVTVASDLTALRTKAIAMSNYGLTLEQARELEKAIAFYGKARDIFIDINEPVLAAAVLANLGTVYARLGDYDTGLECYSSGLDVARQYGDEKRTCTGLLHMGHIYHLRKNYTEALAYYFECLKLAEDIHFIREVASSHGSIGRVYARMGKHEEAKVNFTSAIQLFQEIGQKGYENQIRGWLDEITSIM